MFMFLVICAAAAASVVTVGFTSVLLRTVLFISVGLYTGSCWITLVSLAATETASVRVTAGYNDTIRHTYNTVYCINEQITSSL